MMGVVAVGEHMKLTVSWRETPAAASHVVPSLMVICHQLPFCRRRQLASVGFHHARSYAFGVSSPLVPAAWQTMDASTSANELLAHCGDVTVPHGRK